MKGLQLQVALAAAERVGIELRSVDRAHVDPHLYAWVTPEDEVLYFGKAQNLQRLRDEENWRSLDPKNKTVSGIVTLLRVNRARPRRFHYDASSFDPARARNFLDRDKWEGAGIDTLRKHLNADSPVTREDVERFLIRVAVRYGTPIGNSSQAGQWESQIGQPMDTLAVLAVAYDEGFEVPAAEREAAQAVADDGTEQP